MTYIIVNSYVAPEYSDLTSDEEHLTKIPENGRYTYTDRNVTTDNYDTYYAQMQSY